MARGRCWASAMESRPSQLGSVGCLATRPHWVWLQAGAGGPLQQVVRGGRPSRAEGAVETPEAQAGGRATAFPPRRSGARSGTAAAPGLWGSQTCAPSQGPAGNSAVARRCPGWDGKNHGAEPWDAPASLHRRLRRCGTGPAVSAAHCISGPAEGRVAREALGATGRPLERTFPGGAGAAPRTRVWS